MQADIERIIDSLARRLYFRKVMDNRERGDYAEELVAQALGNQWEWVGIGWHPWDFEGKVKGKRIRIQVKQSAARQIWQRPDKHSTVFQTVIKKKPTYVEKDHPGIEIEDVGRFCEIFIFAWHGINDIKNCDQREPDQWIFFVVPEKALGNLKQITLVKLESDWLSGVGGIKSTWNELNESVLRCCREL